MTTVLHHLMITLLVCTVLASSTLFSIDIRFCGHKIVYNDLINMTRQSDVPSTTRHYDKVPKYFLYNSIKGQDSVASTATIG